MRTLILACQLLALDGKTRRQIDRLARIDAIAVCDLWVETL
jgi:hypothetical protein